MLRRNQYLAFIIVGLCFFSCSNSKDSGGWKVLSEYNTPQGLTPLGITAHDNLVAISDSSANRVLVFDMATRQIHEDISIPGPGHIRIRKNILLMPSMIADSIFIFRRTDIETMPVSEALNAPLAIDAQMAFHYAIVQKDGTLIYTDMGSGKRWRTGTYGEGQNAFGQPADVLITEGRIYLVDAGLGLVHCFDSDGNTQFSFGADLGLKNPSAISSVGDTIFVSDTGNNRVLLFNVLGQHLGEVDHTFSFPTGLDYVNGRLFVANAGNKTITVLVDPKF